MVGLVVFVFSACGRKSLNRSLEEVFHKDAPMVVILDFTDNIQQANFNKLVAEFPTTGFGKLFINGFDSKLEDSQISWDKDIAPIFKGKWSLGFATDQDLSDHSKKPDHLYFAGKFSEIKAVKSLLNKSAAGKVGYWENVEYEKNDGVEYWTNNSSQVYLAIDDDIFLIANSDEARKSAVNRLEKGLDSFDGSKMSKDGFVRVYAKNNFSNPSETMAVKLFGQRYLKMLEAVKFFIVNVSALEGGFKAVAFSEVEINAFKDLGVNPDYRVSLIDKVNSKGLIYYGEGSSMKAEIWGYLLPDESDSDKKLLQGFFSDSDKQILKKLDPFFSVPYAIAISDRESFLPAVAVYFQFDEKDAEKAKVLSADFDGYVDEVIKELTVGFLKKDLVAVKGGALHKVYFDWKALPISQSFGIDLTSMKTEFYYGLMGDNVFVLALYTDFPNDYGQNPLSADPQYLDAVKKLGDIYGSSVSYLNTAPFLTYIDRFIPLIKADMPEFQGSQMESMYKFFVRNFIGTMKYFIASDIFKGGQFEGVAFLKIEKMTAEGDAPPSLP